MHARSHRVIETFAAPDVGCDVLRERLPLDDPSYPIRAHEVPVLPFDPVHEHSLVVERDVPAVEAEMEALTIGVLADGREVSSLSWLE